MIEERVYIPRTDICCAVFTDAHPGHSRHVVYIGVHAIIVDVGFGYRLAGLVVQRGYIQSYGVYGVGYGAKAQHEHYREDTSEFLHFVFSFFFLY